MLKKLLVALATVAVVVGVADARSVDVSSVSISNVDVGAGTCTINYTLENASPGISTNYPVWVFVKWRKASETDYTGWKDTDNATASDDNVYHQLDGDVTGDDSKNQVPASAMTVNKNLSGDVGLATSAGSKSITWTWGSSGTGLSNADQVRVRVYAVEMVRIPGGTHTFGWDSNAQKRIASGSQVVSEFHLMRYLVMVEMYKDFLNACANLHDPDSDIDDEHDFYLEGRHLPFYKSGTLGIDATFSVGVGMEETGDGQDKNVAMPRTTWWNAMDWCKWAGLSLPREYEWEWAACGSNPSGSQNDFPWGDTPIPSYSGSNWYCNMDGDGLVRTDVTLFDADATGDCGGISYQNGETDDGVAEMAGHLCEWVFTLWYTGAYDNTKHTEASAGYGNSTSSGRVTRGGDYSSGPYGNVNYLRTGSRLWDIPSEHRTYSGFRAARLP